MQRGFFYANLYMYKKGEINMKNFITVDQLTKIEIMALLETAQEYKKRPPIIKDTIFVANLFFEPSTRTKMSFQIAEQKIGLNILEFIKESSSIEKGESLYDTAKTLETIGAHLLVIRHSSDQWIKELDSLNLPIINAGAGKAEHPTQCMLDLYTIFEEFGTFKELNITIAGDIRYSRVAHSLAKSLTRLGAHVFFSSTPGLESDLPDVKHIPIDEAVEFSDVTVMLRIQNERHVENALYEEPFYLEKYGLTIEREKRMKDKAIIMHPAPVNRGVEIDSRLVECDRSRIFKQMNNGVYIRMAIINKLLSDWGFTNENITGKHNNFNANKSTSTF